MRRTIAACMLFLAAACESPESGGQGTEHRELEFIEQPVTRLHELDKGIVAIGLGPMARWFVIHPEFSPNPEALAALARRVRGSGRAMHATVWIRDHPRKTAPTEGSKWPFIVVRLAEGPDPRAEERSR